ncbi:hypothetical protein AGMMS50256_30740 [Betaproteobacteria bacterium]|nr:hypothetical protein AGMMS50256_30740 [Betaproteobacteria bacterium]
MASNSISLGVVIGGAVGSTFGKAIAESTAKIGTFQQRISHFSSEQRRIGQAMSLRGLNLSKFGELRKETLSLGKAFKDSSAKTMELGARLAATKTAAKHFPSLGNDVKKLTGELERSKKESAALESKWRQKNASLNRVKHSLNSTREEYAKMREEMERLKEVNEGFNKVGEGIAQTKSGLKMGGAITASATPFVMKAADYQAIVRGIAIKGGFANTEQERDVTTGIRASSQKNGIGRDELAKAIDQLVSGGMDSREAMSYADLIGKFSVGQGTSTEDTAKMISALSENALIKDAGGMAKALEAIAYLGQAGNFESQDMARSFPALLAQMQANGITGQDAVTQLGSMLQIQRKTAGTSEETVTHLQGWMSKIGAEETVKNYEKSGVLYKESMEKAIQQGYSPLEASLALAKKYVEKTDPKQAEDLKKMAVSMNSTSDPDKKQRQIQAFEETLKTGDLFRNMQVKAALTAYMQNSELYEKLKRESAASTGLLEKNLVEARETSKQKWGETAQAFDNAMESVGNAIRPVTDGVATLTTGVLNFGTSLANINPTVTKSIGTIAAGSATIYTGYKTASGLGKMAGGAYQVLKNGGLKGGLGSVLGKAVGGAASGGGMAGALGSAVRGVQNVFVTNMPMGGIGDALGGGGGAKKGFFGKIGDAVKSGAGKVGTLGAGVLGVGKAALAAPSLSAVGAMGAGTVAASGAMVTAAGAAGYGVGTLINKGIDKAMSAATGKDNSLGTWLYEKLHPEEAEQPVPTAPVLPKTPAPAANAPAAPFPAPAKDNTAPQQVTFSPSLQITVQGDVKDPRKLADELMPHLRRMFDQFQQKASRGDLFDPAHA